MCGVEFPWCLPFVESPEPFPAGGPKEAGINRAMRQLSRSSQQNASLGQSTQRRCSINVPSTSPHAHRQTGSRRTLPVAARRTTRPRPQPNRGGRCRNRGRSGLSMSHQRPVLAATSTPAIFMNAGKAPRAHVSGSNPRFRTADSRRPFTCRLNRRRNHEPTSAADSRKPEMASSRKQDWCRARRPLDVGHGRAGDQASRGG